MDYPPQQERDRRDSEAHVYGGGEGARRPRRGLSSDGLRGATPLSQQEEPQQQLQPLVVDEEEYAKREGSWIRGTAYQRTGIWGAYGTLALMASGTLGFGSGRRPEFCSTTQHPLGGGGVTQGGS